jgi:hypothetical protein
LGTTSVKLSDFVLGSTGMLPWVVTCSYLGSALRGVADVAGKGRRGQSKWAYALYALGAVGTMGVVAAIGIYTRRAMEEILREEPSEGEERKEAEDRGRRERRGRRTWRPRKKPGEMVEWREPAPSWGHAQEAEGAATPLWSRGKGNRTGAGVASWGWAALLCRDEIYNAKKRELPRVVFKEIYI